MDKPEMATVTVPMRHLLLPLSAACLACMPSVASACLYPPRPLRNADETDAQYNARALAELNSFLKESARKTEASYFNQAKDIYFARIIKSEEINVGGSPFARKVTVRPLQAIRGNLPPGALTLKDRELTSCGLGGDGPATWGGVSHIVIVFGGVRNEGMEFRSDTYAVLASEVRHPALVEAWTKWKARTNFAYDQ